MSKGLGQLEQRCLAILRDREGDRRLFFMLDVAVAIAAPAAPTPALLVAVRRSLRSLARKGLAVVGERDWGRKRPVYTTEGAKRHGAFTEAFMAAAEAKRKGGQTAEIKDSR